MCNSVVLTMPPPDGAETVQQAAVLTIEQIG
jgi:hypothetical protein